MAIEMIGSSHGVMIPIQIGPIILILELAIPLLQDVFLKAMRKIGTFRGRSSLSTWLYRVAINHSRDHLRRKKRKPEALYDDGTPESYARSSTQLKHMSEPESIAVSSEAKRLGQEALAELPPSLRMPLVLHELEGLKYEEVSRIMHLPVGTVKSRIFRARVKAGQEWGKLVSNAYVYGITALNEQASDGPPDPPPRRWRTPS